MNSCFPRIFQLALLGDKRGRYNSWMIGLMTACFIMALPMMAQRNATRPFVMAGQPSRSPHGMNSPEKTAVSGSSSVRHDIGTSLNVSRTHDAITQPDSSSQVGIGGSHGRWLGGSSHHHHGNGECDTNNQGCANVGSPPWGYYAPYFPSYSYYPYAPAPDTYADSENDHQQAGGDPVNSRSSEDGSMQRQEVPFDGNSPYPASWPQYTRSDGVPDGKPLLPATVVVFNDQHKQELRNYAIVRGDIWNFLPQDIERIALAEVDLAATIKANQERGLSFRVPTRQTNKVAPQTIRPRNLK